MPPWRHWYIDAFWRLHTERPGGMGVYPIPWSKVEEYGRRAGLDEQMREVFHHLILVMDRAFIDWQLDQSKRDARRSKKGVE